MATYENKTIHAEAVRKTEVETTYEYVPILGEILGFWRTIEINRLGDSVQLHIRTPLENYDNLFVNGKEVPIPTTDV